MSGRGGALNPRRRLEALESGNLGAWVQGLGESDFRALSGAVAEESARRGFAPDYGVSVSDLDAKLSRIAERIERDREAGVESRTA